MTRVLDAPARAGGALLAGAMRIVGLARRASKPLHPRGHLVQGVVTRTGGQVRSGVPWLDEPGSDDVLVRVSRAVGLPEPLPDIHGLALRVPVEHGHADLLLATTGLGRATRFLLKFSRRATGRPLTTLLPYRGPRGPLLLAARPLGADVFELLWASPSSEWVSFGRLALSAPTGADPDISFDPLVNVLPGLTNYDWVRRLREPAYRGARQQSHRRVAGPVD